MQEQRLGVWPKTSTSPNNSPGPAWLTTTLCPWLVTWLTSTPPWATRMTECGSAPSDKSSFAESETTSLQPSKKALARPASTPFRNRERRRFWCFVLNFISAKFSRLASIRALCLSSIARIEGCFQAYFDRFKKNGWELNLFPALFTVLINLHYLHLLSTNRPSVTHSVGPDIGLHDSQNQ